METATQFRDGIAAIRETGGIEELATNHFERVFLLFGTFFEDPQVTMGFTESAFRAAEQTGSPTPSVLYQCAVDSISDWKNEREAEEVLSLQARLCWLLKELGMLRYHEIANILGIEYEAVKHNIAETRFALMPKLFD